MFKYNLYKSLVYVFQVYCPAAGGDHIWEGNGDLFCLRSDGQRENSCKCLTVNKTRWHHITGKDLPRGSFHLPLCHNQFSFHSRPWEEIFQGRTRTALKESTHSLVCVRPEVFQYKYWVIVSWIFFSFSTGCFSYVKKTELQEVGSSGVRDVLWNLQREGKFSIGHE